MTKMTDIGEIGEQGVNNNRIMNDNWGFSLKYQNIF